jgi:hypothetical protein
MWLLLFSVIKFPFLRMLFEKSKQLLLYDSIQYNHIFSYYCLWITFFQSYAKNFKCRFPNVGAFRKFPLSFGRTLLGSDKIFTICFCRPTVKPGICVLWVKDNRLDR